MPPPPTTAIMLSCLSRLATLADEASEELACPLARRTEHDLAWRPGMDDPATVHEHDPVGDVECEADNLSSIGRLSCVRVQPGRGAALLRSRSGRGTTRHDHTG